MGGQKTRYSSRITTTRNPEWSRITEFRSVAAPWAAIGVFAIPELLARSMFGISDREWRTGSNPCSASGEKRGRYRAQCLVEMDERGSRDFLRRYSPAHGHTFLIRDTLPESVRRILRFPPLFRDAPRFRRARSFLPGAALTAVFAAGNVDARRRSSARLVGDLGFAMAIDLAACLG
jgi:hypothetical protein